MSAEVSYRNRTVVLLVAMIAIAAACVGVALANVVSTVSSTDNTVSADYISLDIYNVSGDTAISDSLDSGSLAFTYTTSNGVITIDGASPLSFIASGSYYLKASSNQNYSVYLRASYSLDEAAIQADSRSVAEVKEKVLPVIQYMTLTLTPVSGPAISEQMGLEQPSDKITLSPNANYGIAITVQPSPYSLYTLPGIEEYIKYIVLDFRCAWDDVFDDDPGYGTTFGL